MINLDFTACYAENINRRRKFCLPGYKTLADAGFDGEWVTPYQITSRSPVGPALIAYNWFDMPSAVNNRHILSQLGYMPGIPFNEVLDIALNMAGLSRQQIYMTQAFHLLPATRSQQISAKDVDASFDSVTKYELRDRAVIALGSAAILACRRHNVTHIPVCHPSARGRTYDDKAREIAVALLKA